MTEERRRRLEAAGYRFTTVREFLGLTSAEMALIDMKVALARALKALRRHRRLTRRRLRSGSDRANPEWRRWKRPIQRCRLICCFMPSFVSD